MEGTCQLPDGTVLRCGLWQGRFDGPFDGLVTAEVAVRDHRFGAQFTDAGGWTGPVSASVELVADGRQPDEVRRVIGDAGEALAYADVTGPGYRALVHVVEVERA